MKAEVNDFSFLWERGKLHYEDHDYANAKKCFKDCFAKSRPEQQKEVLQYVFLIAHATADLDLLGEFQNQLGIVADCAKILILRQKNDLESVKNIGDKMLENLLTWEPAEEYKPLKEKVRSILYTIYQRSGDPRMLQVYRNPEAVSSVAKKYFGQRQWQDLANLGDPTEPGSERELHTFRLLKLMAWRELGKETSSLENEVILAKADPSLVQLWHTTYARGK